MKRIVLILVVCMFGFSTWAQSLLWEKSYSSFLVKYSAIESFDRIGTNYVLSVAEHTTDAYKQKLILANAKGDTIWTKKYADSLRSNYRNPVKVLNNSIYYFPNYAKNNSDTAILNMFKIDMSGNAQKLGIYQMEAQNSFFPRSLYVDDSSHLYLIGLGNNSKVASISGGGAKVGFIKVDTMGNQLFQNFQIRTDTISMNMVVASGVKYHKNNFVFWGDGNPPGIVKPFIMKTNQYLDTIATKLLFTFVVSPTSYYDGQTGQLIVGQDGQFYLCGSYKYSATPVKCNFFIAKLDTSLNVQWVRECGKGFSNGNAGGSRLRQLPDGNLLLVGSDAGTKTIAIYKITTDGAFLDSARVQTKLGSKLGGIRDMRYFPEDSSIVFAGSLDFYAYLAKISLKRLITGTEPETNLEQSIFSISPNPSTGQLTVNSYHQLGNLEVYNTEGQLVKTFQVQNTDQPLDVRELLAGVYLYRFSMESGVKYGKFVKQ